jgi:hypothetical protein
MLLGRGLLAGLGRRLRRGRLAGLAWGALLRGVVLGLLRLFHHQATTSIGSGFCATWG